MECGLTLALCRGLPEQHAVNAGAQAPKLHGAPLGGRRAPTRGWAFPTKMQAIGDHEGRAYFSFVCRRLLHLACPLRHDVVR